MINELTIVGRLGKDPETRETNSGTVVTKFSVATSRTWTKDGDKQEKTTWHNVEVWGSTASACADYLRKGSLVYVSGPLEVDEYDDKKTGETKRHYKLAAQRVKFLDKRDDARPSNGPGSKYEEGLPF